MSMRVRDPRLILLIAAAMLGAAVAFPLGVIASHQFTDVPDSSTYHDDIDAIRDAGITTGCALNLYCPKAYVTREQMAAFMNRLGALQAGKTPVVKAATAQNADDANQLDGLESTQFARSDVAATGYAHCGSREMQPMAPGILWATGANHFLHLTSGPSGSFSCGVHLPNGSTITAFTMDAHDSSTTETVACRLKRWTFGEPDFQAPLAEAETGVAEAPSFTTVTDTTINSPTVDNEHQVYATECTITGDGGADNGFYGTRITYTVAGLPVE